MLQWVRGEFVDSIRKNPREFLDSLKPQSADDYFAMAVAHHHLGEKLKIEKALRSALQRDLAHTPSLYALALRAFERAQEKVAKNLIRRAIRLDPSAATTVPYIQRELRSLLSCYETACRWGVWCLGELETVGKATVESRFHLGKTLFEQSRLAEAAGYLRQALANETLAQEAAEYLSYIYEHLYKGDELIAKTLELAKEVPDRSDLFFNLAMVCQHEQKRFDLAMHFFYLAHREDSRDPGLRFSLEQAALEVIGQINKRPSTVEKTFLLMLAHLYQGSMGMAKRYAQDLKELLVFPESFVHYQPEELWREWLLKDKGILGQNLRQWFGPPSERIRYLPSSGSPA